MPKVSIKGQQMPESPIRKLVPYAEIAKKKGREEFCFGDQNDANEFFYFIIEN